MSPIDDDILSFSRTRKDWQQDVLRRLFVQDDFGDSDFQETLGMLKSAFGLRQQLARPPIALAATHIPQQSATTPPVVLNSLGNLLNTNRLATGQILHFALDGLTVVYGDNGSGKSGYCRILKKLCRVHDGGVEEIRGDAFDRSSIGRRAEATIRFTVGTDEPTELRWKDGTSPPQALARISVFDAKTVALYADQENKIEFLPRGLDALTRLGQVCERLAATLDSERVQLERRVSIPSPNAPTGTAVSILLGRLTTKTLPQDLPTKDVIEAGCTCSDQDMRALREAEKQLTEDPETMVRKCRALIQTIATIEKELEALTLRLDVTVAERCRRAWEAAKIARDAAALAARQANADDLLPGFGSAAWRLLLQHAKHYSSFAYPNEHFPVTRDDARCVLCQQALGPDAIARFKNFDEHLQGVAETHAVRQETARDQEKRYVEASTVRSEEDVPALLATLVTEDPSTDSLVQRIASYVGSLALRKRMLLNGFATGEWDNGGNLPQSPVPELVAARNRLETKIEGYNAMRSPVVRSELETKVKELTARQTVSPMLPTLLQRREDLDTLSRLIACKAACDTREISLKNTALRKQHLTKEFQDRLAAEIADLNLGYLPFKIQDRSDHGTSYIGVGLEAPVRVRNKEVLSDGEFRALAIACFLAEVKGIDRHNAIIIDDPVSSLDSQRTRCVARRLVSEAREKRQVVVFTHDLVFYHELRVAAAQESVPIVCHWIRRTDEQGFGTIFENEEPWQAKRISERLGQLERKLAEIRKVPESSGDAYREKIKDFYSDLRETWERLIEELLLNGVIGRFQRDVATLSLKAVRVDDEDYKRVFFGMKRASEYSGHDKPVGAQLAPPRHDDVAKDLANIRSYSEDLKKRNKKLEDERKLLEKPPQGVTR